MDRPNFPPPPSGSRSGWGDWDLIAARFAAADDARFRGRVVHRRSPKELRRWRDAVIAGR